MLVVDVVEELSTVGLTTGVVDELVVVIGFVVSEVEESVVDEVVELSEVEEELSVLRVDVEASVDGDVSVVLEDVEIGLTSGVAAIAAGPGQSGHWKQLRS